MSVSLAHFCDEPATIPIHELATKVEDGKWAVADFQRDLVWKWPNMKKFLESLYLGIPIGIIYTWGYEEDRPYRPFKKLSARIKDPKKIENLILDGQQRVTFLSWIFRSRSDSDIFPIIAFNVKEKTTNAFRKVSKQNPLDNSKGEISLQRLISQNGTSNCKADVKSFNWYDSDKHGDIIDQMKESLYDREIAIQNVKNHVSRAWALFIFDRVNREGKQLSEVDLVESILVTHWPKLFQKVRNLEKTLKQVLKGTKTEKDEKGNEKIIPVYSDGYGAAFNRNAIIRSMLYQLHGTTKRDDTKLDIFEPLNSKGKKLQKNDVKKAFKVVKTAMSSLKDYINTDLHFNKLATFSYLSVVVATQYLIENPSPTPTRKSKMLAWFCIANIQPIYTGGSTYDLADLDCDKATSKADCWESLIETIQKHRSLKVNGNMIHNVLLKDSDFGVFAEKPISSGVATQLSLTQLKWDSSEDWLTGHLLGSLDFNKLENHHIFPISKFEKTKLSKDLEELGKKENKLTIPDAKKLLDDSKIKYHKKSKIGILRDLVKKHKKAFWEDWGDGNKLGNHFLNRAWIKKRTNNKISNSDPVVYLPKLGKDRLESQGVPTGDNSLYNYEKYEDFITKRIELQTDQLNSILKGLWSNRSAKKRTKPTAKKLISSGEGQKVEFKSSFQWCYDKSQKDGELVHDVVRAICAMLNTGGGNVFVGVDNSGTVLGLAKDLGLFKNDEDKFDTGMLSKMKNHFSPPRAYKTCVTPFPEHDNKGTLLYYHFKIDGYHQDVKQKKYRSKKKDVVWIRHGKRTEDLNEEE